MALKKRLVLGSALWAWGLDRHQVFDMLDRYTERGGTWIDTAVNYPINKQQADYGKALAWFSDWLQSRQLAAVSVILKIGAIDNLGNPDVNLTPEHIHQEVALWRGRLGPALALVAVHWDNRGEGAQDRVQIRDTLSALAALKAAGLEVGFSGVRHPTIYREEAPDLADDWWIQVKENASTQEARMKLQDFFPKAHYLAYGINMGGVKPEPPTAQSSTALRGIAASEAMLGQLNAQLEAARSLKPAPSSFNEMAMHQAFFNDALSGIVIGPRTVMQLDTTLNYWQQLVGTTAQDSP